MKSLVRKLLLEDDGHGHGHGHGSTLAYSPSPFSGPINASSSSISEFKRPLVKPNTPFDSSMALTVVVLLTALFFMGFFSVYIRRFAEDSAVEISRRRRHSNPTASSSSMSPSSPKGLDHSVVSSLPLFSFHGDAAKETMDCPVCLTQFEDKDTVKIIPFCRHVFHPPCIDTWLSSHVSCPVCRSTQLFPAKEVEEESDEGGSQSHERSTVENGDTCVQVESLSLGVGVMRTTSCSGLGERPSLHRTSSF